tara:strand:- start:24 stop:134 length:111 start_codon:yes stop_codon:yes gene_type:complete
MGQVAVVVLEQRVATVMVLLLVLVALVRPQVSLVRV